MPEGHYLVLARKWRPQTFEDVVGQEHVTRTLQNAIRAGRISHAFLFIGSRGIGKTTTARILAKALNCSSVDAPTPEPCGQCDNCVSIAAGNNIDVIEIDGASNNSVEDVRQIRENVRMVPSGSRYKIYVIDEVHQLSMAAFNALLKTLEEPPSHAVFILATTEAHKIPATIVSRCQRYDFRRVGLDSIVDLLRGILEKEGVTCSDEALYAIARAADGGVRDAESVLDQLVSYCGEEITFQDVVDVLGLVDWRVLHDMCNAILEKDVATLLKLVEDVVVSGKDLSQFIDDVLRYFRNLLVCKTAAPKELLALPDEEIEEMVKWSERFTLVELIRLVEQFAELSKGYDSQLALRTALEALLIKLSRRSVEVSVDTVLEKLMQLSESVGGASGALQAPPVARAVQGGSPAVEAPPMPQPKQVSETPPPPKSETNKIDASNNNVRQVWKRVLGDEAVADALSLSAALREGRPDRVENGALVLQFDPDQEFSRQQAEQSENVALVEKVLQWLTANLTEFRTETALPPDSNEDRKPRRQSGAEGKINEEAARSALEDPHIATIIDVFKGNVVDVREVADGDERDSE